MSADPAAPMSRRVPFFPVLTLVVTLVVLAMVLFVPRGGQLDGMRVRSLVSASEVAPGEVRTFSLGLHEVVDVSAGAVADDEQLRVHLVRLDDGELRAFDVRSTHLGCTTVWREVNPPGFEVGMYFSDVCSGATFTIEGSVIFGPAPRGLDRLHVEVAEDAVIVDPSRVTRGGPR